jgi:hypothetical protein
VKNPKVTGHVVKKIVISKDIIFEEEKHWDWDISYTKQLQMDLEWGEESETDEDETNGC